MPGPEELSREELLALLAAKDERIDALLVLVGELTAQVQTLVLKLGKDSATSSKPPSSDGPGRRPDRARRVHRGGAETAHRRPGVHADETFTCTAGRTGYVHVACTEHLTLLHTGNGSAETIDAGRVLTELSGVLVRDGYAECSHLKNVLNAWCSAPLLRDCGASTRPTRAGGWAKAMADTPLEAHRIIAAAREQGRDALTAGELGTIRRLYTGALALALALARVGNPARDTCVLAGHARTLAARFEQHRDMTLRFTTDLAVPFTNNLAERNARPVKVQQRSSGGCWRTLQGLADFAVVQSYLSTAAHWGITHFDALYRLFTTGPGYHQRTSSGGLTSAPGRTTLPA